MMYYTTEVEFLGLTLSYVVAASEPTNQHDLNTVVMTGPDGQKLGYQSAAKARLYAKPLQKFGPLQLKRRIYDGTLLFDLPKLNDLRRTAAT